MHHTYVYCGIFLYIYIVCIIYIVLYNIQHNLQGTTPNDTVYTLTYSISPNQCIIRLMLFSRLQPECLQYDELQYPGPKAPEGFAGLCLQFTLAANLCSYEIRRSMLCFLAQHNHRGLDAELVRVL